MSRRSFFLLVFLASGSVLTAVAITTPPPPQQSLTRFEPLSAAMVPPTFAHFGAHAPKH